MSSIPTLPFPAQYAIVGEQPRECLRTVRAVSLGGCGCQGCCEQRSWLADLLTVGNEQDARDADLMLSAARLQIDVHEIADAEAQGE